jgi:hypothetical protein
MHGQISEGRAARGGLANRDILRYRKKVGWKKADYYY